MDNVILPPYSVLMSVYAEERPEHLRQSLQSLLSQTYPADEVVLVCDGALGAELDSVISCLEGDFGGRLKPLRLPENVGTAKCANIGLRQCKNEYIMKMDSDDICMPDRAMLQMTYLAQYPQTDILGGYIEEFDSDTNEAIAVRKTPQTDEEIRKFARRRMPFNNQTVVYKKSAALSVDGYSETLERCEDYDFAVRMLMSGANAANLPQVIVRYRVSPENLSRRRNFRNTKDFIAVRKRIYKMGYSNLLDFLIPCACQLVLFITPEFVTGFIYKKLLRKG